MTALDAALSVCAVADRSDLGRLVATGPDLLDLLHRLSTGDVKNLRPGEGRETVVTNAKGRIVERLFVHHLGDDGVLLVTGPLGGPRVLAHLRKFTFAENTGLSDTTLATFAYALIGPRWADAARIAGLPDLPPYAASAGTIADSRVLVIRANGFDDQGVLVVGPRDDGERVRAALVASAASTGGTSIDAHDLEAWRILSGFPAAGSELTEDYNPLEAGLREAVSFTKGCYVGQEVVARLNTYGKVARALVRMELEPGAAPSPGASIRLGGNTVGVVTSAVLPAGAPRPVALGYVKTRDIPEGTTTLVVEDGDVSRSATLLRG